MSEIVKMSEMITKSLIACEIQKEEALCLLKWGGNVDGGGSGGAIPLLSSAFMEELSSVLDRLEREKPKVLIALSEHPSVFCAGADLKEIQSISSQREMQSRLDRGAEIFSRFEQLKCAKIALIQGACLGGGLEWALCFDFLLLEDSCSTRLAFPEVKLGLIPALGGLSRLPQWIGLKNSLPILLKGQSLSATEALSLGLAFEALPSSLAKDKAFQLARDIIEGKVAFPLQKKLVQKKLAQKKLVQKKSAQKQLYQKKLYRDRRPFSFFLELLFKGLIVFRARRQILKSQQGAFYPAPFEALRAIKRSYGFFHSSVYSPVYSPVYFLGLSPMRIRNRGMRKEREAFCRLFNTPEAKHLMRIWEWSRRAKKGTFFKKTPALKAEAFKAETSAPTFGENRPLPSQEREVLPEGIKRVGVVGAGQMGKEIAFLFADKGFEVRLMDNAPGSLVSALSFAEKIWEKQELQGKINSYERKAKRSKMSFSLDFSGFSSLDLVIEAVSEDKALKLKLLSSCLKN